MKKLSISTNQMYAFRELSLLHVVACEHGVVYSVHVAEGAAVREANIMTSRGHLGVVQSFHIDDCHASDMELV